MTNRDGQPSYLLRARGLTAFVAFAAAIMGGCGRADADEPQAREATPGSITRADGDGAPAQAGPGLGGVSAHVNQPADQAGPVNALIPVSPWNRPDTVRTLQNIALFGLVSLAPVGLLMVTAFVRINIVLILLRQALGSPQVPGNQVLTALALMLTALVMRPRAEEVYQRAIEPYSAGRMSLPAAWEAGTQPIKAFMVEQIVCTKHEEYLQSLYEYEAPSSPGRSDPAPARPEEYPLRVVAPAYLLSELTTALLMGFYIYLPFLVIDLVVSSVLAATGLFMLPPALVATPIKLIVFVLADGWLLVATMLLSSFAAGPGGP